MPRSFLVKNSKKPAVGYHGEDDGFGSAFTVVTPQVLGELNIFELTMSSTGSYTRDLTIHVECGGIAMIANAQMIFTIKIF